MIDADWKGTKIGFIGKGGAGKSTCVALFARAMCDRGSDVCVLDTDSTNEGLHAALGIPDPPRALIDHFGGMVFRGGKVTCPVDDPTPIEDASVELEGLPSEYVARSPSGVVLLVAGKLAGYGVGAGCDGPLVKIARDLTVHRDHRPMTMLVDLKAGLEDASRGALVRMDATIIVCDPTRASLEIVATMTRLVDQLRRGAEPATFHLDSPRLVELARSLFRGSTLGSLSIVLNRVPDAETERLMLEALRSLGIEPIAILPERPEIRRAWLRGAPLPLDEETRRIVDDALGMPLTHASRTPIPAS
jgi:CO dehydrogenase nickel-insertion accessory protein CooC1